MKAAHQHFLFVFPPTGKYCREDRCQSYFELDLVPTMRAPLEECEAAGTIVAKGGRAEIVDAPALDLSATETLLRIRRSSAEVLIITITFGSLEDDLAFAALAKAQRPDRPIGLRGAPCYTHAREILSRATYVDFLVRGDYELVFASIMERGIAAADGVTSRTPLGVRENGAPVAQDLDALAWPDRSTIDRSRYLVRGTKKPQATIRVQRGCPFPCTYCLVATVSGKKARHRSPESIAREMSALQREGYEYFYLRADTFSADAKWARSVCEAIASQAPGARWITTTRIDTTDETTLAAMAKAGCYGISFGVETGSVTIGARVKKIPDLERTREVFRECDKHGILSLMYVMLGFLWETPDTLAETERFVQNVRPDLLTLYFAHPYPGTAYYDDVRNEGVQFSPDRAQAAASFEPPNISLAAIKRRAVVMTARHYTTPSVVASIAKKMARPYLEGTFSRMR